MTEELLRMGRVGRPHGIRGEFGVDWAGDYVPAPGDTLFLQSGDHTPASYQLISAKRHNGRLLLMLNGIASRTAAAGLTGATISMRKEDLPAPADGDAFLADLLGMEVWLDTGELAGRLDHVEFPAQQVVWVIRDAANNEILFPARPEFIKDIESSRNKIIISPPPGLLEIYRA